MAKFESFRPQLKPGRLIPHGERVIFESEDPFDQVILPVEVVDFLLLCNGELTVAEIIELVYKRRGLIQFKAIYRTLNHLKSRDLLVNGQELETREANSQFKDLKFFALQPFFEKTLRQRIFSEKNYPFLFYAFSMLTIVAAILSFQWIDPKWYHLSFLKLEGSFLKGFVFTFVAASALLTLKSLYKALMLLFLTGRAYNLTFAFSPMAAYFRINSDSLFLVSDRLFIGLFHLSVCLCYFPILGMIYFLWPSFHWIHETMSLAIALSIFDLDPFRESETTSLIRSFLNDDTLNRLSAYTKEKPLLSMSHPFERNRDHRLYVFLTHLALIWAVATNFVLIQGLAVHASHFFMRFKSGPIFERLAAGIIAAFMICYFATLIANTLKVLSLTLINPVARLARHYLKKKHSQKLHHFNEKDVIATLSDLPLFGYFSDDLLVKIVQQSTLRQYTVNAPVIVQGSEGRHLFCLLNGKLQIQKQLPSGRQLIVGDILPPSLFGEVAVIEESPRSASVIATKDSVVLEIPAHLLKQVADDAQYIRELESFRNAIMVNQFFTSAPVFRELDQKIVQMFISKGKIETYDPDQVVFKQGDRGDEFYLILRGSVGVSVNGHPITRIQQGGFFGEISMIADVPRTGTIYARESVQALKVSRDSFWEILSHDINIAMFIESVGEMRVREDIDIIRAGRAKVS